MMFPIAQVEHLILMILVIQSRYRKRAEWRKEMMSQAKAASASTEDEDGW